MSLTESIVRKASVALVVAILAALAACIALPTAAYAKTFPDVSLDEWYYEVVGEASDLGLVTGYDNGLFGPGDNITRGQVATILHRASGEAAPAYAGRFPDVPADQYYTAGVEWAASEGIVTGYASGPDAGRFAPERNVAREDLMVMLARYASSLGVDTSATDAWAGLARAGEVDGYARAAVAWGVDRGVIGSNGDLNPRGNATRAEAAKMMLVAFKVIEELAVPKVIEVPEVSRSFAYNGSERVAVSEGEGYTLSGTWKATNAGWYKITATLARHCIWADGTTEPKQFAWQIIAPPLTSTVEVGDSVSLGSYEQDGIDGMEPLQWRVLDVQDGKALLLCEYGLDYRPFNERDTNYWPNSTLKAWLEGDFVSDTFTATEQARFDGKPFCLTIGEVDTYGLCFEAGKCYPIPRIPAEHGACNWWTQSGASRYNVIYVDFDGIPNRQGTVPLQLLAVRPALWVNL